MSTERTEARRATAVQLIADDLTGAADASVPFVLAGWQATVLIDPRVSAGDAAGADPTGLGTPGGVHALSTNSRGLGVDAARLAVRDGLRALGIGTHFAGQSTLRFKKIDSTLRGHVAMETAEAFDAWSCRRAVIAPAVPEQGRTFASGSLSIHGVSAGISASDLFARASFTSIVDVSESAAESGVLRELAQASHTQSGIAFICDATEPATLDHIVDALWDLREDTLWVGASGLARALARRVTEGSAAATASETATSHIFAPRPGGCALLIGSMHGTTNRQCDELEAAGELTSVTVTPDGQQKAVSALEHGRDVLVRMRNDQPDALAAIVKAIAIASPAGVIMSGGDSAVRVCEAAGVTAFRLEGEVEPGVPWGQCIGGALHGVPAVLKSGGFGQPDTLLRAVRFLTRQEENDRV